MAVNNYQRCNQVEQRGHVQITPQTLEDHYFLSFIDMSNIQPQ